jgi:hypothetical protein
MKDWRISPVGKTPLEGLIFKKKGVYYHVTNTVEEGGWVRASGRNLKTGKRVDDLIRMKVRDWNNLIEAIQKKEQGTGRRPFWNLDVPLGKLEESDKELRGLIERFTQKYIS